MPLDPSIILQAKPVQYDNPLNALAQYSQIQNAQNQNALSQYTIGKAKRDDEKALGVQNALIEANGDLSKAPQVLAARGYGKEALDFQKSNLEQDEKRSSIAKNNSATKKTDQETASHQFEIAGQLAASWAQNPAVSKAQIQAGLNSAVGSGIISPEIYQAKLNELGSYGDDPSSLNAWAKGTLQQVLKAKESLSFIQPDANAQLSAQTSRQNNAASNATSLATNANTVNNAAQTAAMADRRATQALSAGKTPPGYRTNPDGSMSAIPGGPADIKASKEGTQKVSDAKDVLSLLDDVDKILPKATGSYLGAAYDQGQRAFGNSTSGAEASAQLKALQGALVSKMPKMSGPQSDKDVALYREMAGQIGDETLPISTRQAAVKTIRALNEKYAGMEPGSSIPAASNLSQQVKTAVNKGESARIGNAKPPSVSTEADYNRLPSGTIYMAPDGSMRTKQ